jgi:DNA-binding transcriptional LysR family regulator
MLDVEKLLALRAVAAHGTIAAAARELGYTRSAVSQQVSALERAAGTVLLLRSGNSVTVTPVGRSLLEHTERILVELRAAQAALQRSAGEIAGELRVGVPFREGPPLMSSALTGVRRQHPKLELTLASTTDGTGAEEVRRGVLDLVMVSRFGPTPGQAGPGLRQCVLGRDPLRLCVSRRHRMAEEPDCRIADLSAESWIISPTTPLGQLTLGLCSSAGFQPTTAATVHAGAPALGLVEADWGITIAPELTPTGRGPDELRRVALRDVGAFRHSVLLMRDGDEDSPAIAAVVSAVRKASSRVALQSLAG